MMSMLMEPFAPWQRDVYRHLARAAPSGFFPPADIIVTDNDVSVYLDVPGMRPEEIQIELENDILTISGERRFPYAEADASRTTWRRIERPFGSFERSLRVPQGLDPNGIEAAMQDGVLSMRMQKPQPLRPHRIEVRTGAGQPQPVGAGQQAGGQQGAGQQQQAGQQAQGAGQQQQQGAGQQQQGAGQQAQGGTSGTSGGATT